MEPTSFNLESSTNASQNASQSNQTFEEPQKSQAQLNLRNIVRERRNMFIRVFFVALIIAIGKYIFPLPQNWLAFIFNISLFVIGVTITPFIFLTENWWKSQLIKKFQLIFDQQESPLRNGLLFFILPVLGFFIVTSSRSPLGLGFMWGISSWYAYEAWKILSDKSTNSKNNPLLSAYFPTHNQQQELPVQQILWGYCIYVLLLSLGILFI